MITPFKIVKIHMTWSIYASAFLEFVFHVICNVNEMQLFCTFSRHRFATVIMTIMLIKVSCEFLCYENTTDLCSKFTSLTTFKKIWFLHIVTPKNVRTNKTESKIWHLHNCWMPGFICLQDDELYSCSKVIKRKI